MRDQLFLPAWHEPPGPGGLGTGKGCASASVGRMAMMMVGIRRVILVMPNRGDDAQHDHSPPLGRTKHTIVSASTNR